MAFSRLDFPTPDGPTRAEVPEAEELPQRLQPLPRDDTGLQNRIPDPPIELDQLPEGSPFPVSRRGAGPPGGASHQIHLFNTRARSR